MNAERLMTALLLVCGLIFLVVVIPAQVEEVDYGRIGPGTLPRAIAIIVVLAAGIQLLCSRERVLIVPLVVLRSFVFVSLIVVSVYLMSLVGFEYIAPLLALGVMLLIGERRWYWLVSGCLIIPISSWLIVEQALNRVLP
ncbi:MAG: tripartite tricarboxylate transporter TctB family protein [Cohaesibacter sp.]|nr:tripartite tricarboxylate transporter TctB family protein [Cohaesibacter sp.]